jgi:tRNA U34 5-carboxymethylaminomethyl modifying GTPase MnmE/TrmE
MKDTGDSFLELLNELRESFELLELPVEARQAKALTASIGSGRPVRIVVVGEFNSGKSTLVNALCGANLLPAGIIPTTATINIVEYSSTPGIVAIYTDESRTNLPFSPDVLQQFTARSGDQRDIREIRVSVPNLPPSLVLIDTPGVNDINQTRSEIVYQMIPEADAVIFLMDIQQPLKRSEVDFLRNRILGTSIVKTMFVLNHVDRVSNPNEIHAAVDYVHKGLRSIYREISDSLALAGSKQLSSELRRADIPIFTVSAKRMLRSSGVETLAEGDPDGFRSTVFRLAAPEVRMQTIMSAIAGQVLGLAARLRREIDERSTMQSAERELTLAEVRRNAEVLRNALVVTRQALSRIESQHNVLRGEAERAIDGVFQQASASVAAQLESNGTEKGLQIIQQQIGRNLESKVAVLNEHIQQLALESAKGASTFLPVTTSVPSIEVATGAPHEQRRDWLADLLNDPIKGAAFWVLAPAVPFLFGPIGFVLVALPFVARLFAGDSGHTSVEDIQLQITKAGEEAKARICVAIDARLDAISTAVIDAIDEPQQRIRAGCVTLTGEGIIQGTILSSLRERATCMELEFINLAASSS